MSDQTCRKGRTTEQDVESESRLEAHPSKAKEGIPANTPEWKGLHTGPFIDM